jgi:4'-phosphopantetheinyl transferase
MPKVWEKSVDEYSILVWQSTEPLEDLLEMASLNEADLKKFNSFISLSRKREWLTVRKIIKLLIPGTASSLITYEENGKPRLEGCHISISHSHDWIAIMVSEKHKIGIDIEIIGQRIENLAKKFLSSEEDQSAISEHRIEKLHIMWGAKEVLYKIHALGNVIFKKDLFVFPFNYSGSGQVRASIMKKGYERDYTIHYLKTGDYMLAWSMEND